MVNQRTRSHLTLKEINPEKLRASIITKWQQYTSTVHDINIKRICDRFPGNEVKSDIVDLLTSNCHVKFFCTNKNWSYTKTNFQWDENGTENIS